MISLNRWNGRLAGTTVTVVRCYNGGRQSEQGDPKTTSAYDIGHLLRNHANTVSSGTVQFVHVRSIMCGSIVYGRRIQNSTPQWTQTLLLSFVRIIRGTRYLRYGMGIRL